jgi:hypothetical protein
MTIVRGGTFRAESARWSLKPDVARGMAVRFWEQVVQEDRVSVPFREIDASNLRTVRAA